MNVCILAGGSGTRLWPLSRKNLPKQFLSLVTENTLFQDTIVRVSGMSYTKLYVICNEEHRFLVAEQLRELGVEATILLESHARNTAPAIGVLSHCILQENDEPTIVLAADHYVGDSDKFCRLVSEVMTGSEIENSIILFGIKPTFASTGYGYIEPEFGAQLSPVVSFKEKPDTVTAEGYLSSDKGYLWNSGMFMFKPSVMVKDLEKHSPIINSISRELVDRSSNDLDFIRLDPTLSADFPDIAIDIAVLEKSGSVYVRPFDVEWSDVGVWKSLYDIKPKDECGNSTHGEVLSFQAKDNLVLSDKKLVVAAGVSNLAIIESDDAILVMDLAFSNEVGSIVKRLESLNRPEHIVHREVHRPWGKYDSIDLADRHQVKRITVNPGKRLSLQMHYHRAEHWIVVKGTALVTIDGVEQLLSENQSTYIPLGKTHRLENPGTMPLEMIEVQSGSYLGEDDIVRFQDEYGRH